MDILKLFNEHRKNLANSTHTDVSTIVPNTQNKPIWVNAMQAIMNADPMPDCELKLLLDLPAFTTKKSHFFQHTVIV